MAAAAGKKDAVSLSLFMEVNDLEVEEDISTMASLPGRKVSGWEDGQEQQEAWRKQIFEVQNMKTGERICRRSRVRRVIWASSAHTSTPCLRRRCWWT